MGLERSLICYLDTFYSYPSIMVRPPTKDALVKSVPQVGGLLAQNRQTRPLPPLVLMENVRWTATPILE